MPKKNCIELIQPYKQIKILNLYPQCHSQTPPNPRISQSVQHSWILSHTIPEIRKRPNLSNFHCLCWLPNKKWKSIQYTVFVSYYQKVCTTFCEWYPRSAEFIVGFVIEMFHTYQDTFAEINYWNLLFYLPWPEAWKFNKISIISRWGVTVYHEMV